MLSLNFFIQIVIHLLILPIRTIPHTSQPLCNPRRGTNISEGHARCKSIFTMTNKEHVPLKSSHQQTRPQAVITKQCLCMTTKKTPSLCCRLCCEKNMPSDSENNFLVLTERTFKLQSHHNAYQGSSITVQILPAFVVNRTSRPLQFNLPFFRRTVLGQSQWPHGLRCGPMATHLLGLWV